MRQQYTVLHNDAFAEGAQPVAGVADLYEGGQLSRPQREYSAALKAVSYQGYSGWAPWQVPHDA